MKIPSAETKACWLDHRIPITEKQVKAWEAENPPETWVELPDSLKDPVAILQRGEVPIRRKR